MDNNIPVELAELGKGRKKLVRKEIWAGEVLKKIRYSPKRPHKLPTCTHTSIQGQVFQCEHLNIQDISKFHRSFFKNETKILQDNFLTRFCRSHMPKNIKVNPKGPRKNVSISYFIPKHLSNLGGRKKVLMMRICQKAFLGILQLSKDRVQRICRKMITSSISLTENRGGDKKSHLYIDKKVKVINFILSLQSVEPHYARGKSKIQYLSSDLSIKKLHNLYNGQNEDAQVKYEYFRNIFTSKFNLSFRSPSVDACSYCLEYMSKIKLCKNLAEKPNLMAYLRVHKLRAKAFYTSLKNKQENELTLSFDCQKNMVLPKVPDQQAYFSRQLYVYNFTICEGSSGSKQNKTNTFIYSWLETEAAKGSNEISSCIFHRLNNTDWSNIKVLKLFCDGCPGQNKNSTLIGMLAHWLKAYAPGDLQKIVITFPIVGHSFLPPDRVFGRIEKQVKRKDVIETPEEYFKIFSTEGTIVRGGVDYNFYDWKSSCQAVLKHVGSWGVQFATIKKFHLKKTNNTVKLRGEPYYISDINNYVNICKRGKSLNYIDPSQIPIGVKVKDAKLMDVTRLLKKHFGENWETIESLKYYKDVISSQNSLIAEENEGDEENGQDEDDDNLRI